MRFRERSWAEFVADFWSKVSTSDECWLWTGCTVKTPPRPKCYPPGKRYGGEYAHRVAWRLAYGETRDFDHDQRYLIVETA